MNRKYKGALTIEFLVILPIAALAFVALLGLAEAVLIKQQATIAAYGAGLSEQTGAERDGSGQTTFPSRLEWKISRSEAGDPFLEKLKLEEVAGSDITRLFVDNIDLGGREFRAVATPDGTFVKRLISRREIDARYEIPVGFWESDECGVLIPLLKDAVTLGGKSIIP